MTAFYDEMAALALDMIGEFGQTVTLQDIQEGEYDPELSGTAPGLTLEQTPKGILIDFTGLEFQNSSLIVQGDKKLKIPAAGLDWPPKLQIKAVIQGKAWTVINVKEINPAGTPILYELQVRA